MTRAQASVVVCVDDAELECILWAACPAACAAAGVDAVRGVAVAVARGGSSQLHFDDRSARNAALELISCASFVRLLAAAYAAFLFREALRPTVHDLVHEAARREAAMVASSYALARAYLAQRELC